MHNSTKRDSFESFRSTTLFATRGPPHTFPLLTGTDVQEARLLGRKAYLGSGLVGKTSLLSRLSSERGGNPKKKVRGSPPGEDSFVAAKSSTRQQHSSLGTRLDNGKDRERCLIVCRRHEVAPCSGCQDCFVFSCLLLLFSSMQEKGRWQNDRCGACKGQTYCGPPTTGTVIDLKETWETFFQ